MNTNTAISPPKTNISLSLQQWLVDKKLEKYFDCFANAGVDVDILPHLTESDLCQMGISTIGARKKIILGVQSEFLNGSADDDQENNNQQNNNAMRIETLSSTPAYAGSTGSILRFFQGNNTGNNPSKIALKPTKGWAHAGNKKNTHWKSTTTTHQQQQQHVQKASTRPNAKVYPFKSWQQVPGTHFIVDRFGNLPVSTPNNKHWFLTHFHADHYKGLTSKFSRGTIYCTPITSKLIKQQLKVSENIIHEVPIGTTIYLTLDNGENVEITFLPANHCPGAAMLLFKMQGQTPLLHTGDCRLTTSLIQDIQPTLEHLRGAINIVLDTTYCDPQYTFPPQAEALKFVIDAVKAEAFNPQTLYLFGSYTIGKERVYLEVAKALRRKVYVSATKKKILDCLEFTEEEASLLTTDDSETNLHVVPLWMITRQHMANSLKFYRGRFTNIIGFKPTGWTHQKDKSAAKTRGKRKRKGTLILYGVPYSEHSSFNELCGFVQWLKPRSILPSVNNDGGGPRAQHMVNLLRDTD